MTASTGDDAVAERPAQPIASPGLARLIEQIQTHLADRAARSLRRRLEPIARGAAGDRCVHVTGRDLVNLAGNDYLGLAGHPALRTAAIDAVTRFGVGAGASRLVTGHFDLHARVEADFARFKHAEAALLLPTGFMANLAVLTTLARPGDLICLDKLSHASLIDAARASGATVRVFPHLGYDKLARLLDRPGKAMAPADRQPRRFIVTDSVFSMDGDVADLPRLCELADRHQAVLVVDEAHATGVLGDRGAGLAEAQGVADRVGIVISTASKALGGLGGIVTGPRAIIDMLVNAARPVIYTTAVPPAQTAAIAAALDVVRQEPWRRQRLAELAIRLRTALADRGWRLPNAPLPTPIIPLIIGDAARALALAHTLRDAGFMAPAIRPPTVAPGAARVRLSLRCDLEDADLDRLLAALDRR